MSIPATLVQSWLDLGRARVLEDGTLTLAAPPAPGLLDKVRHAYGWISTNAIHTPYRDMEFGPGRALGTQEQPVILHDHESYSSFILMPLLTLLTSRRLLFIGAPGRGKTTMATLMAMLSGCELKEARRAIQHGHPQLTQADLLGSPLPSQLIRAEVAGDIAVNWRQWLSRRVKVVDEYNRIPTKTQSALLSLMADGYAEMYEQVLETGRSAWFLTANDEQGGGTFPVIEALKDRIDVVVRCTPYHARFLNQLVDRIESARRPEEFIPADIVFTNEELDDADAEIRAIEVPMDVREVLGFFIGQLDFCRRASTQLEYMNKDTLHLAGRKVAHVCNEDCPLDKRENLCTQSENGVSARSYQTLIHYAKALAWFRGQRAVDTEDLRQLIPWVLHERLTPNLHSAFFQKTDTQVYLTDKVGWIRQLFDRALEQHAAWQPSRRPILELEANLAEGGLAACSSSELQQHLQAIRGLMEEVLRKHELNGPVYEDLVRLKNIYYDVQQRLHHRRSGA